MAGNSFGQTFRFTTWGESHGEAIGVVIDGIPSQIPLCEEDIQPFLDKRKPGTSKHTTQRQEPDRVKILSGTYKGLTTGVPISCIIYNTDQRSKDYSDIENTFRPGHADYTYHKKYGIRDPRGGGRSSARETACRVVAGAIARKILSKNITITGAMIQMGKHRVTSKKWDNKEIHNNPFFCPCIETAKKWDTYLSSIRKQGSSIGAIIEIRVSGVPAGWGEPVYDKLDSDIAKALMSINAVKGVEIGEGFNSCLLRGEENADAIRKNAEFQSNHSGGILGGISSGQDIIVRFVVKPTSSILIPTQSITKNNENIDIFTKGRHDPCVGIRAVPVGEAMIACTLVDHYLRHNGIYK